MTKIMMMLTVFLFMVLSVDGQDDAGTDLDMEAMAGGDDGDDKGGALEDLPEEKSMLEQTSLAIQQFSIIIGK